MDKYAGLWIDHREAVVVLLSYKGVTTKVIESDAESHFRLKGGAHSKMPHSPHMGTLENKREDHFKHHLHDYFQEVIKLIEDAQEILIFGPGEAKGELVKTIDTHKGLGVKVAAIEAADKMTETEIVLKVKEYFKSKVDLEELLSA